MKKLVVAIFAMSMLLSVSSVAQIIDEAPIDGLFQDESWM